VPEFPVLIENSRHPALKIPHGEELPCFFFIYCLNHRGINILLIENVSCGIIQRLGLMGVIFYQKIKFK
jgi:hypothetical protein